MAKITNSINLKNALINTEEQTITEFNKDFTSTYTFEDIFGRFEDKHVNISIKEDTELFTDFEEE